MLAGYAALSLGDQHSVVLQDDGSVWSTAITLRGDVASLRGVTIEPFRQVIPSHASVAAAGIAFSMVLQSADVLLHCVNRC